MIQLSDEQQAVINNNGNVAVIAAPGSGKTFLTIEYVRCKLEQNPNARIQLVTFAKDAALEIKRRLSQKALYRSGSVHVTTFDSLFFNLFRGGRTHLTSEDIIIGEKLYAEFSEYLGDNRQAVSTMAHIISIYEKYSYIQDVPKNERKTKKYKAFSGFIKFITDKNKYDLPTINRMINDNIDCENSPKFDFIIVDEFQDINPIQYEWLLKYAYSDTQVVVIGDDDQSIYKFRNAMGYYGFKKFMSDFDAEVLTLSVSYRCPQEVLDSAYCLVGKNIDRYSKNVSGQFSIMVPELLQFEGVRNEVEFFIQSKETSGEDSNTVILSRFKRDLLYISLLLLDKGVRFSSLCVREEVNRPDIQELLSICNLLNTHHLFQFYDEGGFTDDDNTYQSLVEVFSKRSLNEDFLNKNFFRYHLDNFIHSLSSFIGCDYSDVCNEETEKMLMSSLESLFSKKTTDLLLDIKCHCHFKSVGKVLNLLMELNNILNMKSGNSGIELMTMHRAKGLEWKTVWIMAANDFGLQNCTLEQSEEERRIYFVGMTRTTNRLIVTGFKNHIIFYEQLENAMLTSG